MREDSGAVVVTRNKAELMINEALDRKDRELYLPRHNELKAEFTQQNEYLIAIRVIGVWLRWIALILGGFWVALQIWNKVHQH